MTPDTDFEIKILKDIGIFSDLNYSSLKELGRKFDKHIFSRNENIFSEGDNGSSLMLIASGRVRITQVDNGGNEEALIILDKGDVFGEISLFDDMPRSATAVAHTDVIIYEIERKRFIEFVQSNPSGGSQVLFKLGKLIASRLRNTDVKLKAFFDLCKWL